MSALQSNTRPAQRPRRCCVYCGHLVYTAPRVPRIRCPRCYTNMSAQDIVLEGEVTGEPVVTAAKIIVAAEARVAVDLIACDVTIIGRVMGNVVASQICHFSSTGKLAGTVLCRCLEMEDGAMLDGMAEVVRDERWLLNDER